MKSTLIPKAILVLLLLNSIISKADFPTQTRENNTVDNEVINGLDNVYNLRFNDAESIFRNIQKSNPADLRGYFYESLIYFYKALPTRDEALFEKYLSLSEDVIARSEKLLEKNENNFDAMYYKGLSHSYRSLLMLSLNKSLLKAASNGNDGYRILSALTEKNPEYYDAYMGLGLYKIAIGFVPEKFRWLLSLIGFSGNISEGMNLLKKSLAKGHYTKTDSKVFLSIFSIKEKEDEDTQSLTFSKELTEEYPESPVFKVFYSGLLLQYGFSEEAVNIADIAIEQNKFSFKEEIIKAASALKGSAFFRLNDYKKCSENLEMYMKYVNKEDRYNVYMFTLGAAYELQGNRQTAIEKYKSVQNNFIAERDGELDKLFYRYAQNKIKSPLSEFDKKMIKGMNLRESNKTDDAISVYNEYLKPMESGNLFSDDEKIRFYYDLGVAYTYKKNSDKAAEFFNKCIKLNPQQEKWLVPHSYFELGKIYFKNNNKKKAEEMFETVYSYDDFDFESFLEMRLANYINK